MSFHNLLWKQWNLSTLDSTPALHFYWNKKKYDNPYNFQVCFCLNETFYKILCFYPRLFLKIFWRNQISALASCQTRKSAWAHSRRHSNELRHSQDLKIGGVDLHGYLSQNFDFFDPTPIFRLPPARFPVKITKVFVIFSGAHKKELISNLALTIFSGPPKI